jgi:hypothetical protein
VRQNGGGMKVVIQHSQAPLLWTARRTWSRNPREAMVFLDEVRARNHAYWHGLDEYTRVTACKPNSIRKFKPRYEHRTRN